MDWKIVTPDITDDSVRAWELNINHGLCLHLEYKSIAKYVAWMTEKLPAGETSSIWCSGNFSANSDDDAKKIALNSIYGDKEKQKAHLDAIVSELSRARFERGIADA